MNELKDWAGKSEDITLTYDILPTQLLLAAPTAGGMGDGVTPEQSTEKQNKTLMDIEWDHSVTEADKMDYGIAVGCGLLTGLLDSFFISKSADLSIDKANEWGQETINKFVIKIAEIDKCPSDLKGEDALVNAIKHLEGKHHLAADDAMNPFGGPLQHHFRDFNHHCSIVGLLCSLVTQFSEGKIVIGTDTQGNLKIVELEDKSFIGKNTHEKLAFGTIEWAFHMVSDMAGSKSTAGKGTGIPGPVLSFFKEISALDVFKDAKIGDVEFRKWLSKLFNGTLLAEHDEVTKKIIPGTQRRFNLRTEVGLVNQLGLQALPVAMNECLVRGIYFVRRLYIELKDLEVHSIRDLEKIDPKDVLPTNNAVVLRMMTVASGTFTTVDFADAGIRSLIRHKGNIHDPGFWFDFVVRINFVGVGRFVVACGMDGKMVYEQAKAERARKERLANQYEKDLAQLNCMQLTMDQTIALLSLKRLMVKYDIASTKKEKAKRYKKEWLELWEKQSLDGLPVIDDNPDTFFYSESEIQRLYMEELEESDDLHWLYLITLEAAMFDPYCELGAEHDKKYDDLEFEADYLMDVFIKDQPIITEGVLKSYRKAIDRYQNLLTGKSKHKVAGTVGTGLLAVAAGGVAFIAAPVAAPALAAALFGDAVAGLSGAALTSASLALFGGGSLAAGGLGMAGGTAVISGGGALLGVLGGSGASAVASFTVLSDEGYVFSECTKLLTYCKEVLIDLYRNTEDVERIRSEISDRIKELRAQVEAVQEADAKEKKEKKQLIVICKRSIKYLERCEKELGEMIERKNERMEEQRRGSRANNRFLIKDTESIVKKGWYRANGRPTELKLSPEEIKEAIYLTADEIHDLIRTQSTEVRAADGQCEYQVVNDDSYSTALRETEKLQAMGKDSKVLVLNFANAFSPGGGVRSGAFAQEEDLCRKSTLLFSIENEDVENYYKDHRRNKTSLASDAVILSPQVEVFRGADNGLLPDSKVVSVITCAAPDMKRYGKDIAENELAEIFYYRILGILNVALKYGYRHLVLGAFGCGAFGNDANMVSDQFYRALNDLQQYVPEGKCLFDRVVFAVRSKDPHKLNAFRRNFDDSYEEETENWAAETIEIVKQKLLAAPLEKMILGVSEKDDGTEMLHITSSADNGEEVTVLLATNQELMVTLAVEEFVVYPDDVDRLPIYELINAFNRKLVLLTHMLIEDEDKPYIRIKASIMCPDPEMASEQVLYLIDVFKTHYSETHDIFMSVGEKEYYCPNCGASLNEQEGFSPELGTWICQECRTQLFGEDAEGDVFGDVTWYCDSCGAVLNMQEGFTESKGVWKCTECGHENSIIEDDIVTVPKKLM